MTPRERILTVLKGGIPDCVPCCPDISNMVPCRLTGKPFWDIYVYQNPPLWKAHIDAIKYFDLDGGFELFFNSPFGDGWRAPAEPAWSDRIVDRRPDGSFVTQPYNRLNNTWGRHVTVNTADTPPARILPEKIGLPAQPETWEEIKGIKQWPTGFELWELIRKELGDHGVVGMGCGASTCLLNSPEDIYQFYDNPKPFYERRERMIASIEKRFKAMAQIDKKPDFIFCGGSGSLIWQTPQIFRELALPVLKRVTELAAEQGIPTHVHSCGPEKELVKMAVEETRLTVIDPLEIPPMGDCSLAELKRLYGDKIILKGNLHTTDVMLRGSVDEVIAASKQAIADAAKGGKFILSTGDQCGRDTPDENIRAMVATARSYGRY
jgi:uroporphyrinogen decarboxylase